MSSITYFLCIIIYFATASASDGFITIPDFNDSNDVTCKYFASSLIELDHQFLGVSSIFFPEIMKMAKKYQNITGKRSKRDIIDEEEDFSAIPLMKLIISDNNDLLSRKKREKLGITDLLALGSSIVDLLKIAENTYLTRIIGKVVKVIRRMKPCMKYMQRYLAHWVQITTKVAEYHAEHFFDT